MKFMQRAAASAASSPGTDTESSSSKKRKLTHRDHAQTKLDIEIEQASIRAAIDDRDAKRQAALERHAFGADTHWVLDSHWDQNKIQPSKKQPLRIIHVGYGDGDISEEDIEDNPQAGRTSTKRHRASQETGTPKPKTGADDFDNDHSDGDEATEDEPDSQIGRSVSPNAKPSQKRQRAHSLADQKSGRYLEDSAAKDFRDKRKKKEVKLSKLTSISSAGDSQGSGTKDVKCYACNRLGHKATACPSPRPTLTRS